MRLRSETPGLEGRGTEMFEMMEEEKMTPAEWAKVAIGALLGAAALVAVFCAVPFLTDALGAFAWLIPAAPAAYGLWWFFMTK